MATLQDAINAALETEREAKEEAENRRKERIAAILKDTRDFFGSFGLTPSEIWVDTWREDFADRRDEVPLSELGGYASFTLDGKSITFFLFKEMGHQIALRVSAGRCPDCLKGIWSHAYYNVRFENIGQMLISPNMPQHVCEEDKDE